MSNKISITNESFVHNKTLFYNSLLYLNVLKLSKQKKNIYIPTIISTQIMF